MNSLPQVTIIVVNWNGLEDTRACARSLLAQRYEAARVFLVDNGSANDEAAQLRDEFPGFTHLAFAENKGFAIANNLAMERALGEGADYVLLLNNDTVVAPEFLERLVDAARTDGRIGMVVPKIYFYDSPDQIWFAGSRVQFGRWPFVKHAGEGETDRGQYDVPTEPGFATACCVLVSATMIRQIGMLDPSFGFYCEDVDWSLRAQKAGWHLRYEPHARVWHRINRSMHRAAIEPLYYSYRNIALLARRHLGFWRSRRVAAQVALAAWEEARATRRNQAALMDAAYDALLGRSGLTNGTGASPPVRLVRGLGGASRLFQSVVVNTALSTASTVRRLKNRPARHKYRAQMAAEGRLRIAINIDGQFQPLTGIQHYVDSLLGALLETDTRHEITAFAPALFDRAELDRHARNGGFAWRDQKQARIDSAGSLRYPPWRDWGRVPFRRRMNDAYARRKWETLPRRAERASERYDLLHVPCPVPLPFESYRARVCVATIHDLTTRLFPEAHDAETIAAWERMFRFAQERCARVLAVSESTRRDIIEQLAIEPQRIVVTPLAPRAGARRIDDPQILAETLRAVGLTSAGRFVLYAGTVEPRKNIPRLLEAFAHCIKRSGFEQIRLVLAGGGTENYVEQLHVRAAELGILERVVFTGYASDETLNALMTACGVFAYVSRYEGFGLPPLEAMSCGAPVVASNAASLPEVVGEAGVLVAPDDVEAIAAALARVLTDEDFTNGLRQAGRTQAAKFSWRRTAELTLRAYEAAAHA